MLGRMHEPRQIHGVVRRDRRSRRTGLLQQIGDADHRPADSDGEHRQHDQRHVHHLRRFVGMIVNMVVARLAGERHVPQPEHVKRRDRRPAGRRVEKHAAQRVRIVVHERERLGDDRILRVIAAQPDQKRNSAADDRQAADQHRVSGVGHLLPQPAHLRHVVGMTGVNHRARAEEQQALEKRVRDQMEQPGQPTADPQGQHHVAQLAHRRIGEHALDIDGRDGDRRGENSVMQPAIAITNSTSGAKTG